jgi:hypothetical protein
MKTKEQLLEEIKELESNIETGKKFVALGYPADMLIATSEKLLEQAKEELKGKEV